MIDARVFDYEGLVQRMGGDEFVEVFVGKYCACAEKLLVLLRGALDAGDYPEVRLQAHSIKGAAASIGAEVMRATALKMEHAAQKPEEQPVLPRLLADLEAAFTEFRRVASPPTR